jgi:phosphatidylglycerol:prolipoprotein diacylglycerol transferase
MILIRPISPVAIDLFGIQIRWYAIAYILAFVAGFWMVKKLAAGGRSPAGGGKYYDDLFTHLILGVIIGGRLGYVLFYNLPFFLQNPLEIFMVWHGGMSFHGGLLGVIAAVFLFARSQISVARAAPSCGRSAEAGQPRPSFGQYMSKTLGTLDILAVVAPIGLFFGRIANFVNMEVMGRATLRPWGVVFAGPAGAAMAGDLPRHPSPLYEAALEGVVLFAIMMLLRRTRLRTRAGALSGIFGVLYGAFRILCEQFREPDAQIGFLFGTSWLTMGALLSAAMIAIGAGMVICSHNVKNQ